jgi:hypothetical protein
VCDSTLDSADDDWLTSRDDDGETQRSSPHPCFLFARTRAYARPEHLSSWLMAMGGNTRPGPRGKVR